MKNKISIVTAIIAVLISLTACNKEPEATNVEVLSGDNQTGEVGTVLTTPIAIVVKDQNGDDYQGAIIKFAVSDGSVSQTTATTDVNGNVSVTWTLGSTEGEQTLTITAYGEDGTTSLKNSPITVNATANIIIKGEFSYQNTSYNLANGLLIKIDNDEFAFVLFSSGITFNETNGFHGNGQIIEFDIYVANENDISGTYCPPGDDTEFPPFWGDEGCFEINAVLNGDLDFEEQNIMDGTIIINQTGNNYEITFNTITNDGMDLIGSYTGNLIYLDDEK